MPSKMVVSSETSFHCNLMSSKHLQMCDVRLCMGHKRVESHLVHNVHLVDANVTCSRWRVSFVLISKSKQMSEGQAPFITF